MVIEINAGIPKFSLTILIISKNKMTYRGLVLLDFSFTSLELVFVDFDLHLIVEDVRALHWSVERRYNLHKQRLLRTSSVTHLRFLIYKKFILI